jgi:alcohol dehydrogenase class IV
LKQFAVEGTSLVSWTIRVKAEDEREAVEKAECIAGWIDMPAGVATVHAAEHRVVSWGQTAAEGQ